MYEPYHGLVWEGRRTIKARGGPRRAPYEQFLIQTAAQVMLRDMAPSNAAMQPLLESIHYFASHRVLYVATPLAQQLMDTKIEIPPDELQIPYHLFEICLDNKLEIRPGLRAASCLVLARPDEATFTALGRKFQEAHNAAVDLFNREARFSGVAPLKKEKAILAPRLRQSFILLFRLDDGEELCQFHLRFNEFAGVSTDEAIEKLLSPGPIPGFNRLGEKEIEVERCLCRVALGCLCYLNTLGPDVSAWKDHNRPSFGIKPESIILGKEWRVSPGWHLRKAHWRFLRHKRFRRDESGNIRCRWVKGAEINPKLKGAATKKAEELK